MEMLSLSKTIKTRLDKIKTIVTTKIGTPYFKELESYKKYSESSQGEVEIVQTSALSILNYLSKDMIEKIFINLNK